MILGEIMNEQKIKSPDIRAISAWPWLSLFVY